MNIIVLGAREDNCLKSNKKCNRNLAKDTKVREMCFF